MKISELTIGQGNVEVEGTVSELGETKSFNKFGKELSVANAMLTDESGTVKLTLWNDDVTRFKDGDKLKVVNGYVNEFQGEKQLTSGKYGSLEKVDGSDDQQTISESASDETAEPAEETTEEADPTSEEPAKDVEETPAEEPASEESAEEANKEPTSEEPTEEIEETTF